MVFLFQEEEEEKERKRMYYKVINEFYCNGRKMVTVKCGQATCTMLSRNLDIILKKAARAWKEERMKNKLS